MTAWPMPFQCLFRVIAWFCMSSGRPRADDPKVTVRSFNHRHRWPRINDGFATAENSTINPPTTILRQP